ncbi:MAG: AzlD domain-containing protein [Actinomycetota bacterium]
MIDRPDLWLAIVVAAFGTYAIRTVPLALAGRVAALPVRARRSLRMVAPAALSALVCLAVFRPDGRLDLVGDRVVAATVAGLVGWRTRNPILTLVVGMVVLLALERL